MCRRRLRLSERVFGQTVQFTEFIAGVRTGDKQELGKRNIGKSNINKILRRMKTIFCKLVVENKVEEFQANELKVKAKSK